MANVLTRCPTCGTVLTDEHLMGKYLRCPSCKNEYVYQDGVLSARTTKYYPVEKSWEDFLAEALRPLEQQVPPGFFEEVDVLLKDEAYLPFVDVVTPDCQAYLAAIPQIGADFAWGNDDLPTITNTKHFKLIESSERRDQVADTGRVRVVDQGAEQLDKLHQQAAYVSDEIYYIPVKIVKFCYQGQIYRLLGYGDMVASTGEPLTTIAPRTQKKTDENMLPSWVGPVLSLLVLVVFVAAWMKFCYAYQQLNGLFLMFYYKSGYMCLFRFLGTCLVAIFAGMTVNKLLWVAYTDVRANQQQGGSTRKMLRMRKEALRLFRP